MQTPGGSMMSQGYRDALQQAQTDDSSWWDQAKGAAGSIVSGLRKGLGLEGGAARIPDHLKGLQYGGQIEGAARQAGNFAGYGQHRYQQLGGQGQEALDYFGQRMRGEGDSMAMRQLAQGLAQSQAQQRSMAAGAAPGQGVMAARNAMSNMGRQSVGMSGQAAMAGIAERDAAASQYGNLLHGLRGQDLQATLGSRGQQLGAYGTLEGLRADERRVYAGLPTSGEQFVDTITGGLAAYGAVK